MAFPWRALVLAITINILWGASVPAVKIGLLAVPPLWSAFWRFVLGVVCIAGWARINGIDLRPAAAERRGLALLGALFTLQVGSMYVGIRLTTGAMASVVLSTNPMFATLYSHLFIPGDRLSPARAAGLAIAFLGICLIFLRDLGTLFGQSTTWGNLICLGSAALLGGRLVFTSWLLQRIETTRVLVWQMLFSLPCFAIAGYLTESVRWENLGWYPLAAIAYQGIVVAGFNFMGLAYLLRRYNPSVVVGFNFLSPVFGVLLSALLLAESITWQVLAGLLAVGLGLLLVARK